jgi:hypothetical protein
MEQLRDQVVDQIPDQLKYQLRSRLINMPLIGERISDQINLKMHGWIHPPVPERFKVKR